jgi:hypothetical protein
MPRRSPFPPGVAGGSSPRLTPVEQSLLEDGLRLRRIGHALIMVEGSAEAIVALALTDPVVAALLEVGRQLEQGARLSEYKRKREAEYPF